MGCWRAAFEGDVRYARTSPFFYSYLSGTNSYVIFLVLEVRRDGEMGGYGCWFGEITWCMWFLLFLVYFLTRSAHKSVTNLAELSTLAAREMHQHSVDSQEVKVCGLPSKRVSRKFSDLALLSIREITYKRCN